MQNVFLRKKKKGPKVKWLSAPEWERGTCRTKPEWTEKVITSWW